MRDVILVSSVSFLIRSCTSVISLEEVDSWQRRLIHSTLSTIGIIFPNTGVTSSSSPLLLLLSFLMMGGDAARMRRNESLMMESESVVRGAVLVVMMDGLRGIKGKYRCELAKLV